MPNQKRREIYTVAVAAAAALAWKFESVLIVWKFQGREGEALRETGGSAMGNVQLLLSP
jgi:hypothetical protein